MAGQWSNHPNYLKHVRLLNIHPHRLFSLSLYLKNVIVLKYGAMLKLKKNKLCIVLGILKLGVYIVINYPFFIQVNLIACFCLNLQKGYLLIMYIPGKF